MKKQPRLKLKPRQHFHVIEVNGAHIRYGPDKTCDVLNFVDPVARIGFCQGFTFVGTEVGRTFVVIPTGESKMPWVFDEIRWE